MLLGAVARGLSSVIQVWHLQTGTNPAFRGLPGHGQSVTDKLRDLEQAANPLVALLLVAAAAFACGPFGPRIPAGRTSSHGL